jgi:hypothetical protein
MKKARPRVSLKRETVRVLKPIHLAVAAAAGKDNSEHCVAQADVVTLPP